MVRFLERMNGNLIVDTQETLSDGRTIHTLISLSGVDRFITDPGKPPGHCRERRAIREASETMHLSEEEIRKRLDAGEKIPF